MIGCEFCEICHFVLVCISDTSREHCLSSGPRGGSRHPCIGLDTSGGLPSGITTVITRDRHFPDMANISTQCANIEISCTTSVPRPIKFHGTCLTAAILNSQSARNKVDKYPQRRVLYKGAGMGSITINNRNRLKKITM